MKFRICNQYDEVLPWIFEEVNEAIEFAKARAEKDNSKYIIETYAIGAWFTYCIVTRNYTF